MAVGVSGLFRRVLTRSGSLEDDLEGYPSTQTDPTFLLLDLLRYNKPCHKSPAMTDYISLNREPDPH